MKKTIIPILFFALFTAACNRQNNHEENAQEDSVKTEQAWTSDSIFKTPESVIYDMERDALYASNINGKPGEKDGNGFISKFSKEGQVEVPEWIKGLNAPKGMGVLDSFLFVADIDELVQIDIAKGQVKERFPVDGARFLNDVTVADDGIVFFSDSETGAIHRFVDGRVEVFLDSAVEGVNGLLYKSGKLLALVNGDQTLKEIDIAGKSIDSLARINGHGDGIVAVNDAAYLISNWEGEVYYWEAGGEMKKLIDTKAREINAADIEYIQKNNLLLVPTFFGNRVTAYKLKSGKR